MSSIIFKRLFEVVILHDYFLTTVDGISFFDKNKVQKNELITKKLSHNIYDVRDLFEIEPVGSTKKRMSEYKLLIAKTAPGFIVGAEVESENKAGEILYKPRFQFNPNINLAFSIKPTAAFFNSITNISLRPVIPSIYYFTNKNKEVFDETTVPPYTSLPISNKADAPKEGKTYEMGALIDFAGTLREARQYTDGSDPSHWDDSNDKRFVNDADRILLPHNFSYSFKKGQDIEKVDFVLENESDIVIKTISISGTKTLENVPLNFTKIDETDENSDTIPTGMYILKVKPDGVPEIVYQLYLNDTIYNKNSLGVLDIRFDELDSPYSLLDAENFLKTRISAANEKITHPIFEVRLKNRKTYWRYNSEGDFSADDINSTSTFLEHSPEKLISLDPKGLTETLVPFINGDSLLLPHPRMPAIKIEKDRIFSEIFINQSNRLLNN